MKCIPDPTRHNTLPGWAEVVNVYSFPETLGVYFKSTEGFYAIPNKAEVFFGSWKSINNWHSTYDPILMFTRKIFFRISPGYQMHQFDILTQHVGKFVDDFLMIALQNKCHRGLCGISVGLPVI